MSPKLEIALIVIMLTSGWSEGGSFNSFGSSSDRWHLPATPEVVSREVQFANGSAHLVGTLYLPKNGNHLPA